jgi:hypothetical protein
MIIVSGTVFDHYAITTRAVDDEKEPTLANGSRSTLADWLGGCVVTISSTQAFRTARQPRAAQPQSFIWPDANAR